MCVISIQGNLVWKNLVFQNFGNSHRWSVFVRILPDFSLLFLHFSVLVSFLGGFHEILILGFLDTVGWGGKGVFDFNSGKSIQLTLLLYLLKRTCLLWYKLIFSDSGDALLFYIELKFLHYLNCSIDPRKLEPWFVQWSFFIQKLRFSKFSAWH